jgi:ribosomal protein S25
MGRVSLELLTGGINPNAGQKNRPRKEKKSVDRPTVKHIQTVDQHTHTKIEKYYAINSTNNICEKQGM